MGLWVYAFHGLHGFHGFMGCCLAVAFLGVVPEPNAERQARLEAAATQERRL